MTIPRPRAPVTAACDGVAHWAKPHDGRRSRIRVRFRMSEARGRVRRPFPHPMVLSSPLPVRGGHARVSSESFHAGRASPTIAPVFRAGMRALAGIVLVSCLAVAAPPQFDRSPVATGAAAILAQTETLRPAVLELALAAYARAEEQGDVQRPRLTVIDYELPSYSKRLWVIDMTNGRVLHEELVAHGMGSPTGSGGDMERALSFSNHCGTRKSSLGLFRTAETYQGQHGYSLRLDGLEQGINDAARERTIVVHPADYVTDERARQHMVGRSWGCPAVRPAISRQLIDDIKDGSLVFTYFPDDGWLQRSPYLAPPAADRVAASAIPSSPAGRSRPGQ